MSRIALIIGSSRGIGLEFVRQYQRLGYTVYGTSRNPLDGETKLSEILDSAHHLVVDVSSEDSIKELAVQIKARKMNIDLLIHNAGIFINDALEDPKLGESLTKQFQTNSIGPILIFQHLSVFLKEGSRVAFISSLMASVQDNESGAYYGYRASKAALNMVVKSLSIDIKKRGISVQVIHPGYVKTDMAPAGVISTVQSVESMISNVIEKMDMERTGKFYERDGSILPY